MRDGSQARENTCESVTFGSLVALHEYKIAYANTFDHKPCPCLLQNPTDNENQQLKAAEGLFYQEDIFTIVMYVGLGLAAVLFILGIGWEFFYRRPKISKYFFFAPNTRVSVFIHKPF